MRNLARCLDRYYVVSLLGLRYCGPVFEDGVTVYPDAFDRETGVWTGLLRLVGTTKPDVILLYNELSAQVALLMELARLDLDVKVVCYTAVEGPVVEPQMMAALGAADHCVFFSNFAREQAAPQIPSSKLSIIPLGIDTDTFRPSDSESEGARRREARQMHFAGSTNLADAFIVLNANRPWARKRIDLTVAGFSAFAQGKPLGVKLYLHHTLSSELERRLTRELLKRHQVEERVILGGSAQDERPLSDDQLNRLYNACDVGINTSMAEGWGLVSFEHAATRAAQIIPGYGTCGEVWRCAAVPLKSEREDVFLFAEHYVMNVPSVEQIAMNLERLYVDDAFRSSVAAAGYRNATDARYRWHNIAQLWDELFQQVLGK